MQFSLCRNKLHTAWNSACDACEAATNSPGQGAFIASATSKRMVLELYCQPNCRVSKYGLTHNNCPRITIWIWLVVNPGFEKSAASFEYLSSLESATEKQRYESLNGLQKMAKRVGLEHVLYCSFLYSTWSSWGSQQLDLIQALYIYMCSPSISQNYSRWTCVDAEYVFHYIPH